MFCTLRKSVWLLIEMKCIHMVLTNNKEGVLPMATLPGAASFIMRLHSLLLLTQDQGGVCRGMDLKVNIVSREQWGAAIPRQITAMNGAARRVVIHHTALPQSTDLSEAKKSLASIQRTHMTERGFSDIGYNFLIGGDGTIFQGRGWGVEGAHAKSNNKDSVGIAFMGNFNNDTPSAEALSSVKQLLQSGVSLGFLHPHFVLIGHKDLGTTECPGINLYAALSQLKVA